MGVYIKNMEMPISCANCPLRCYDRDDHKFCGATGTAIRFGIIRTFDCPLIEVPKHGDLIDRDALKVKLMDETYDMSGDLYKIFQIIMNAPTIIESDDPLSEMCEDCYYDHCTIADNGTCEKARASDG